MLKFTHKLQCLFSTAIFYIGLNIIFAFYKEPVAPLNGKISRL